MYVLSRSLGLFYSAEQNHLCNFGKGHHEKQFYEIILNFDQLFGRRCRLKTFIILSSGGSFIQLSRTNCAIWFDSIMRNNSVKYYFNLDLWFRRRCCLNIFLMPFCSAKQNHQCNFGKRHFWERFCEIILYFDQLSFKDISYLQLWWPFC